MSLYQLRERHILGQCSPEEPWLHECLRKGEDDVDLPDGYIYRIDTKTNHRTALTPHPATMAFENLNTQP